jgi:hypothetical protein
MSTMKRLGSPAAKNATTFMQAASGYWTSPPKGSHVLNAMGLVTPGVNQG